MAAIAVAGVGMMMVCSSSLAAVMLMGGEEENSGHKCWCWHWCDRWFIWYTFPSWKL